MLSGAAEVLVGIEGVDNAAAVLEGVPKALVNLLAMRVVGTGFDEVDEMLAGSLAAVALERASGVVMLTALPLIVDEAKAKVAGDVEFEAVELAGVETATAEVEDDVAAVKTSSCAPSANPIAALYHGLTPLGGLT